MDHQYNFSITNPIKLYTTVFLYHNRLKKSQPSLNLTICLLNAGTQAKCWRKSQQEGSHSLLIT